MLTEALPAPSVAAALVPICERDELQALRAACQLTMPSMCNALECSSAESALWLAAQAFAVDLLVATLRHLPSLPACAVPLQGGDAPRLIVPLAVNFAVRAESRFDFLTPK